MNIDCKPERFKSHLRKIVFGEKSDLGIASEQSEEALEWILQGVQTDTQSEIFIIAHGIKRLKTQKLTEIIHTYLNVVPNSKIYLNKFYLACH